MIKDILRDLCRKVQLCSCPPYLDYDILIVSVYHRKVSSLQSDWQELRDRARENDENLGTDLT